jgi:hypothetical protein
MTDANANTSLHSELHHPSRRLISSRTCCGTNDCQYYRLRSQLAMSTARVRTAMTGEVTAVAVSMLPAFVQQEPEI